MYTMNLYVLCASHIANREQLVYMNDMMISWSLQTVEADIYISISCTYEMILFVEEFINKWKSTRCKIFEYLGQKMSQFEHYNLLVDDLYWTGYKGYIMFTDDDDIWSKNRVEKYAEYIKNGAKIFRLSSTIKLYESGMIRSAVAEYIELCMTLNMYKYIIGCCSDFKRITYDLIFTIKADENIESCDMIEMKDWLYCYRRY
jgi:hypothetical protein